MAVTRADTHTHTHPLTATDNEGCPDVIGCLECDGAKHSSIPYPQLSRGYIFVMVVTVENESEEYGSDVSPICMIYVDTWLLKPALIDYHRALQFSFVWVSPTAILTQQFV